MDNIPTFLKIFSQAVRIPVVFGFPATAGVLARILLFLDSLLLMESLLLLASLVFWIPCCY